MAQCLAEEGDSPVWALEPPITETSITKYITSLYPFLLNCAHTYISTGYIIRLLWLRHTDRAFIAIMTLKIVMVLTAHAMMCLPRVVTVSRPKVDEFAGLSQTLALPGRYRVAKQIQGNYVDTKLPGRYSIASKDSVAKCRQLCHVQHGTVCTKWQIRGFRQLQCYQVGIALSGRCYVVRCMHYFHEVQHYRADTALPGRHLIAQ